MTRKEFKEKYLDNAFYWVNKGNFMDLQEILQDFGFKCHTGEGFIYWHDEFKNLVTFPADKFHGFEYYQKMLTDNAIDIFVLGDVDEKRMIERFSDFNFTDRAVSK